MQNQLLDRDRETYFALTMMAVWTMRSIAHGRHGTALAVLTEQRNLLLNVTVFSALTNSPAMYRQISCWELTNPLPNRRPPGNGK
jgi:hypothetical protein